MLAVNFDIDRLSLTITRNVNLLSFYRQTTGTHLIKLSSHLVLELGDLIYEKYFTLGLSIAELWSMLVIGQYPTFR